MPFPPTAGVVGCPHTLTLEPRNWHVAEIGFAEWTQNGLLRQPRFVGLRTDKHPREIRRERPLVSVEKLTEKG